MSLIFISHSSADASFAAEVRQRLQGIGHRSIFLDFDPALGIPAGRNWEQELYRNLRACRAVIVLCSRRSMDSRWCFMEITYARALGKHLFPVKVEDCDLSGVLTDRQVTDLRAEGDEAYRRLERGLLDVGLDPTDAFDWDASRPPYPGFLAFQEEDAAVFFGRGDEIDEGVDLLNRVRRLGEIGCAIVLGASGTGKSSLVRAGVVPRLRRDAESWLVVDPFRPRDDPVRELSGVLSRAYGRVGQTQSWKSLAERLRHALENPSPKAAPLDRGASSPPLAAADNPLVEIANDLRMCSGRSAARVLLVVDQLEELLGHPEVHPASRFLALLRAAIEHPSSPLLVLGTLRSDFLGAFQKSPTLRDLRFESLSLGPMSPEDIVLVIEGPAHVAGIDVEPGLVQALAADAQGGDALPLLAFALRQLHERCGEGGTLRVEVYREVLGGLDGAVARAADELLQSAHLSPTEEDQLRLAFLRMVRLTEERRYARHPVRWDDLPKEVHPLLERFVQARLLVSSGDGAERTVEVAHEALFESWNRLKNWLDQGREILRLRREIHGDALSWEEGGRAEEILWRGGRVSRTRELIDSGDLPLDPLDFAFIEAAEKAERDLVDAEAARRRRKLRIATAITVGAVALAGFGFVSARRENRAAVTAEERAREAEVARLKALSAQNFAEHERVKARVEEAAAGSDRAKALAAIAPKYLDQSRLYAGRARRLEADLAAWRRSEGLTSDPPETVFSLDVLQAKAGGSSILHYGPPGALHFMLFDGGSVGVYQHALRPRLEELRQRWSSGGALPLDLVVSSQTDLTHLRGLLDLLEDLRETPKRERPLEIRTLWSNAFVPGTGEAAAAFRRPSARLVAGANELGIPVNVPFSRLITLPEAGAARVHFEHGLTVTVLGPPVEWVRRFADWWLRGDILNLIEIAGTAEPVRGARDYEILENFESPRIELLPSPVEIVDIPVPAGRERSITNLASIVLMLELGGKRVLLPADSRSDVLLRALAQAGYVDERGSMQVDLLMLPLGGGDQSVSVEFFRRVKARHYVVQSDGTFRRPRIRTFEMLFEARRADGQPFTIYLNYPAEEMAAPPGYPLDEICSLFARERQRGTPFAVGKPAEGRVSIGIDLLAQGSGLNQGVRDRYCPAPH